MAVEHTTNPIRAFIEETKRSWSWKPYHNVLFTAAVKEALKK